MEEVNQYYRKFFMEETIFQAYKDSQELIEDLLCFADIYISIVLELKQKMPEVLNLRGVVITPEECWDALNFNSLENRGIRFSTEVKKELVLCQRHIEQRVKISQKQGVVLSVVKIIRNFSLSQWEIFAFWFSSLCKFDRKYERIFGFLQDDINIKLPTKGLLLSLYALYDSVGVEEEEAFISGKRALFSYFLVEEESHGRSDLSSQISVRKDVLYYLIFPEKPESRFGEIYFFQKETVEGYPYQQHLEKMVIHKELKEKLENFLRERSGKKTEKTLIIHLYGEEGTGKKFLWKQVAKGLKWNIIFSDLKKMQSLQEKDILKKLLSEAKIKNLVICFYHIEAEGWEWMRRQLEEYFGKIPLLIFLSKEAGEDVIYKKAQVMKLFMPSLSTKERFLLWNIFLEGISLEEGIEIDTLSGRYQLNGKEIKRVIEAAVLQSQFKGEKFITLDDIAFSVKQQINHKMGDFAALVKGVFTWEDLIIAEKEKREMKMICNQLKYKNVVEEKWGFGKKTPYGKGICAIFYGPPGTGKTMAVQVMANELGMDIYRIDLSQMVSKYIGETEKNITELFKRAENSNALLFFDEADSLFAKRSEIKDAHDRNANTETAHLLQKLEDYEGIAILATNYYNNIDDAFKRRIKFAIKFSFPDQQVRYQLWNSILPKEVSLEEELDFLFFSEKFELSGSSIKGILTTAAYLAAAEHRGIANIHMIQAIKIHYEKAGKVLQDREFEHLLYGKTL